MKIVKKNKWTANHSKEINNEIEKFLQSGGKIQKPREYKEYMASPDWLKTKRHEAFSELGKQCEICGSKENINVHHNNYKCVGVEVPKIDLSILCHTCHEKFHKKVKIKELNSRQRNDGCSKCFLCSRSTVSYYSKEFSDYKTKYRDNAKICYKCYRIFENDINTSLLEGKFIAPIDVKAQQRKEAKKKKEQQDNSSEKQTKKYGLTNLALQERKQVFSTALELIKKLPIKSKEYSNAVSALRILIDSLNGRKIKRRTK